MRAKVRWIVLFALVLAGAGVAQPLHVQAEAESPTGTIEAWIAARSAHDVEGAVALLADPAFLIFTDFPAQGITAYEGKEEIQQVLRDYEDDNIQIRVTETPSLINGTVIWAEMQISNSLRQAGVPELEFFGEAIVEGGKIKSVIYSLTPEAKDMLAAAGYTVANPAEPGMPRSGVQNSLLRGWGSAAGILSLVCLLTGLLGRYVARNRER